MTLYLPPSEDFCQIMSDKAVVAYFMLPLRHCSGETEENKANIVLGIATAQYPRRTKKNNTSITLDSAHYLGYI